MKKPLQSSKKNTFEPHEYQRKAIEMMVTNQAAGLFLDPGMGKTICGLKAFEILRSAGQAETMLILGKVKICQTVWPSEIKKWGFDFTIASVMGTETQRLAALNTKADIYLMNYENILWLKQVYKRLKLKRRFDILFADESTQLKSTSAKRWRAMKSILCDFKYRYIATGSPTPNSLMDLYAQIFLLDGTNGKYSESLGSKTYFKNTFFEPTGYMGYDLQPLPDAEEKVFKKLNHLVLRLEARDYLDLPELRFFNRYVELPTKIKGMYKDLETEFIHELDTGTVTAVNAASKSSKLRQVVGGGVYHQELLQEERQYTFLHNEKTDALMDLVEELNGKPLLVAYDFKPEVTRVLEAFKKAKIKGVEELPSGCSKEVQIDIENRWNRGLIKVLLAHPASAAHGLNLQGTSAAVCFYTLTWNFEHYEQFIARVWRQGQKDDCTMVYHLMARRSIDDVVLARLKSKDQSQKSLLLLLKDSYNTKTPPQYWEW